MQYNMLYGKEWDKKRHYTGLICEENGKVVKAERIWLTSMVIMNADYLFLANFLSIVIYVNYREQKFSHPGTGKKYFSEMK